MEEEGTVVPPNDDGGEQVSSTPRVRKKRKESSIGMSKTTSAAEPSKNGTSTLKHHLICEGRGGSLQTSNFDSEKIRKALIEMIVVDELPFTFVEKYGFQNLMEAACPSFKIPSRYMVSRDVGELFHSHKLELKRYFRESKQRVSLTTDIWTSSTCTNYMCITAHFIDDNWKFHKKIISFKPITSHRGEDIGMHIRDCLYDWDIVNLMSITVDNSSANDVAIEYVRKKMIPNVFLNGQHLHMRCVAHIINLMVEDVLKRLESSIDRVRSAVKYIRLSPSRYDTFRSCVAEKKLELKQLLRADCPTRWDSTCDMLSVVATLKGAFDLFELKDRNYMYDVENGPLTNSDWHYISKYSSILEVFKEKTEKVCELSYVTSNSFFFEVLDLDWKLRNLVSDDDVEFREMGMNMRKKFNKYWREINEFNMYMYFAVILDPRRKKSIVEYAFTKILQKDCGPKAPPNEIKERVEAMVKEIEDALKMIIVEYEVLYDSPTSTNVVSQKPSTQPPVRYSDNDFLNDYLMQCSNGTLQTDTELEIYTREARVPNSSNFDILNWWKVNATRFPILSRIAKDIFAIPISTVVPESAFSTSGRILDSFRSSLGHSTVEHLICTQDWIRKSRTHITMDNDVDELDKIAEEVSLNFKQLMDSMIEAKQYRQLFT